MAQNPVQHSHGARSLGRIALAVLGLVSLGACASIEPRVWQNGRAMSMSYQHARALGGDHSFNNMRQLYQSASPLTHLYGSPRPFQPFGRW